MAACGTDSAGDIELFADHVIPYSINGIDISLVTGKRCDVSHS
ncbi:hypothetical protein ES703_81321 [subsurface metagenome]